jgi:PAS domain S-box-containing protein
LKIRSYLIALILSLFVPFTIFAGVIAHSLAERERAASVDGLRSTARALAIAVDRNVADIWNSLAVLATAELLRVGELKGFHRYAARVASSRPDLRKLLLVDSEGRLLFDTDVPLALTPQARIVSADLDRALLGKAPAIGRNLTGYGALDPAAIAVVVPAVLDGKARYALIGVLDLSTFGSIFADQKLPADWTGVVIDNERIVSRSRAPEIFVGQRAPSELTAALRGGQEGVAEYATQEGWPTLAGFARSSLTGWIVVLGMPVTAADSAAGRILTIMIGIGAAVSLAALAMASFLGRRISRAVLGMLDPAMAIARGATLRSVGKSGITEIQRVMDQLKSASDILADREAQLRKSEGHLARAQSVAAIGSWELTLASGEFHWSDETFRILGLDRKTLSPALDAVKDMVVEEDRAAVRRPVELAWSGEKLAPSALSLDFRWRRPDGAIRILRREGEAVTDASGRVVALIGTVRDVTEIRAAEEQRRELQEQLRQTQKMEVLGQLTGGIAHDFNNLLAVLVGNLELAVRKQRQGKLAIELDEASLRAAARGTALTRQLLTFARRQPLRPEIVDLRELVKSMVTILEPALTGRIAVKVETAAEPCWVEIDGGQCEAALLNLALNARDAMPDGGALTVALRAVENSIAVSVHDTGVGMTAEVQARAFEPFFTTKEVGKGSGLGLSMVYGFVRQSGGRVAIESAVGTGTTVTLTFPRAEAPLPSTVACPNRSTRFQDIRILLVEDDPEVRTTVERMLSDLGAAVIQAADGPAALGMLNADEPPDVVLTDIVMPGMDGIALSRAVSAARPDIRIVFMSGNAELDTGTMNAIDSRPLLVKPFRKIDLAAALCEARAGV